MVKDRIYSTAEVYEMFGISKSTLFRWEREGVLPPIPRDISGQRRYGQEHLRIISERQKEKLGRRYQQVAEQGDEENSWEILEALALNKFLEGDITGIYELAEHPHISPETIRQLMQIALDRYEPGEEIYGEIVRVLWIHSGINNE